MSDNTMSLASDQPAELRKKDGSLSKMRSHKGNIPVLPQTKLCPHCPAKFTRTTHLNRHLRTHTNERLHRCDTCTAEFTRSDLLTRHKRSCKDPSNPNRTRKKSCQPCSDSKIKCDNKYPCAKCTSRGKECIYVTPTKRIPLRTSHPSELPQSTSPTSDVETTSPSVAATTPLTTFALTPEFSESSAPRILGPEEPAPNSFSAVHSNFTYASPEVLPSKASPTNDFYSSIASDSATDVDTVTPIRSHLSSMYSSDMFEPFFSTLFSQPSPTSAISEEFSWPDGMDLRSGSPEEFPFTTRSVDAQSPMASINSQAFDSLSDPSTFALGSPVRLAISDVRHSSNLEQASESQHYLYLFFSAFLSQMPIVHPATFKAEGKPQVLLGAMQACGALFVKTRKAATFITNTLAAAREALIQEFAKNPTTSTDQVHLILAVVLLQTIGLFHQRSDQRASSSIYHGMLVMMIRRTGLISKNASWAPGNLTESPLEAAWQEWATHEMTKRALLLSYLHDCCHCIYFALLPSYCPGEVELHLPCEDNLWKARTSAEWFMALQAPSSYGLSHSRLVGDHMPKALTLITETRPLDRPMPLNPFAHFILIHSILQHLFSVCAASRLPKSTPAIGDDSGDENEQIYGLQYALHNWLQNWINSPELPKTDNPNDEPPFIHHALPFYWLGQVSLLAYQEGLPPFEHNSQNNLKVEVRFRLVKQWLKHIRGFLKKSDEVPTLFWDELMKIRLQTWQLEVENDVVDDQDGLLGFFPDH